ncbi:hypothetical protein B7P43_G12846 [Cryptotermes secundus]|uniref:Mos1 transposase HTH domain-containing protein n=1 Tax=Cryptotermes secundus TaxID=105785 RepID=A0A2J7Q5Q9_9NEOP|nr:hypothetical protein B7P43_G12846 [Cryptotermes secundus]
MLKQAFSDNSLGQTQTYDWYKRFKNGRTSTDDDDRSGRASTCTTPENVAKVRDLILQDRKLTIQDLCNTLGLSYGTCQRILSEELNMRVSSFFTSAQKAQQVKSNIKSMLICFYVHKEFVPHGQTVNIEFYRDVLRRLREDMKEFLARNKMAVVPHPPYSPDLAPCDFFLFPKMKINLKGRGFDTVEEIQAEMQTVLNTLTKKDFQDAFQKGQKRWDQCMHSQGIYFEGDGAE